MWRPSGTVTLMWLLKKGIQVPEPCLMFVMKRSETLLLRALRQTRPHESWDNFWTSQGSECCRTASEQLTECPSQTQRAIIYDYVYVGYTPSRQQRYELPKLRNRNRNRHALNLSELGRTSLLKMNTVFEEGSTLACSNRNQDRT